jgi:NADH-quinone oxidoreductase subunit L
LPARSRLRQFDLKKVFAYSTVSQLGFMFVAVGVLAPVAGVFHLVTHAFFKALLVLSSGVVMHAMAGELDMRKMSGLKHELPKTRWLMLIGCLALAGCPPLRGSGRRT